MANYCRAVTKSLRGTQVINDHVLERTINDGASNDLVLFILCLSNNPAKTVTNGNCVTITLSLR